MKTQRTLTPWTVTSLFAVPLTLVLGAPARAQVKVPQFSAQIGVSDLTDSAARSASRDIGVHAGLSLGLPNKSLLSTIHGKPSFDLDYNHNDGNGGHVDVYGISYVERISVGNTVTDIATHGARPYVGAGIGAFHTDVRRRKTTTTITPGPSGSPGTTTTTTSTQSGNGWALGGKILAGLDFGTAFLEASYQISGSQLGVRSDSANLSVGLHF